MRLNPSLKVEHNSTNNSLSSKNFVMEENLAIFQSIQNSLKEQFASVLIEVHRYRVRERFIKKCCEFLSGGNASLGNTFLEIRYLTKSIILML